MSNYSPQCIEVLTKLRQHKNVLLSGPPATGKTTLMNEVALAFLDPHFLKGPSSLPGLVPENTPPVVPGPGISYQDVLPAPHRPGRRVFWSPFHQGFHPRDFLTGLVADTTRPGAFKISQGTLYQASEFAKGAGQASLLVIDELNRGPAVQIFGQTIAALEVDKRLDEANGNSGNTAYFQHLDPITQDMAVYALPSHLYILAAYNQVDSSIQPLDTAFLRRWTPYSVDPDVALVRKTMDISEGLTSSELAAAPADVAVALTAAWIKVNSRIADIRGDDYRIGHGVLMNFDKTSLKAALGSAADAWNRILQHVHELFFGEPRQLAFALDAGDAAADAYRLEDRIIGTMAVTKLAGPRSVSATTVYDVLRFVGR
jgi:5-methylcytosine-specific restriction protein B